MEETLEGSRGPPRAVEPLERERERWLLLAVDLNVLETKQRRMLINVDVDHRKADLF